MLCCVVSWLCCVLCCVWCCAISFVLPVPCACCVVLKLEVRRVAVAMAVPVTESGGKHFVENGAIVINIFITLRLYW